MPMYYKVAKDLYLVEHTLHQKQEAKQVTAVPTNHIAVIDCSGSMYYDLPQIRQQLKKNLPKLLKEEDTITVIWFSGRNQFGTLLEAEPVASLTDLQTVESSIDRWLKPVGLTGFKEPLEEVSKVISRVSKKHPDSAFSLFFMSDGCDNQWSKGDILKATEAASVKLDSATFVEYGYYADRPLLTSMAERSGGSLIFAENFDRYAPVFEGAVQKKLTGAPKIEVEIAADVVEGFAFVMSDDNEELLTYAVANGAVQVPEDLGRLYYLVSSTTTNQAVSASIQDLVNDGCESNVLDAAYAAVSLYATRMKPKIVWPLLKALGEVKLIRDFSKCFGKQAYSEFQKLSKDLAFYSGERFLEGCDPNLVPAEDAFTVLELLKIVSSDDANRVILDHPEFQYSRIGRGRSDASDQLTAAEQEEIKELTSKLASLKKASEIKEVNERIAEITSSKQEALKFIADPAPNGYSISSLTFNESRPNVSFLVRKPGTVDISSRIPEGSDHPMYTDVPSLFPTFVYRNYAVIKDGLVNIDKLPVRLTEDTYNQLLAHGCPDDVFGDATGDDFGKVFVLNLRAIPVINQKMVKDVSAKTFFETKYALTQAQASQKVYNSFSKELLPSKKSGSFKDTYGADAASWLKEQGITDYSGFSPKTVQSEATDFYMGKELKVNLKGLAKLPSLNELRKQRDKGKYNAAGSLMVPTFELVEEFLNSKAYQSAANQEGVLSAWLEGQTKAAKEEVRSLLFQIAQTNFALVVGQTWFTEFSSLDENSMELEIDGQKVSGIVEMKEIEVKI